MMPALSASVLLSVAFAAAPPAKPDAPAAKKPGVKVTISKETTYITEPLRADGYVDYVAALNQRASQGVTPENNAAVLFWKAMGPGEIHEDQREEFFKLLGIPPLPEKGDYFVPLAKYVKRLKEAQQPAGEEVDEAAEQAEDEKLWEQNRLARKRPWTRRTFPVLAEWLAANEKPLAMLVEASRRTRRYEPLVAGETGTMTSAIPLRGAGYRDAASALAVRAMLRIGEGNVVAAWADLLACHRLARLVGEGPILIDVFVSKALEGYAYDGHQALLRDAHLTPAQIATMRADLGKLPPSPELGDKIDVAERFLYLDSVAMVARDGLDSLSVLAGGQLDDGIKPLLALAAKVTIDWDASLRLGNTWYGRMAKACRNPSRLPRREALRKIGEELLRFAPEAGNEEPQKILAAGDASQAASRRLAQVFLNLFVPAFAAGDNAEDEGAMRFDLVRLAFALAAYRADRGSFPAKLSELAPKYLADVPRDIFTGADLHYEKTGQGYLLYSVGINGKDDGGKTYDDCANGEAWDDLSVRMP